MMAFREMKNKSAGYGSQDSYYPWGGPHATGQGRASRLLERICVLVTQYVPFVKTLVATHLLCVHFPVCILLYNRVFTCWILRKE